MAYSFDVNNSVSVGGGGAGGWPGQFFLLKELLKSAGWTHVASGDGDSNFSATAGNVNDVITSGGSGANGMQNPRAYWIGQQPSTGVAPYSGTRQALFQMNTSVGAFADQNLRIAYSYSAGWSGGSPSITQTPDDPADIQYITGGGTAAAPTFSAGVNNIFASGSNNSGVGHYWAGDVDENFSFGLAHYSNGNSTLQSFLAFDGLDDFTTGDLDPYAWLQDLPDNAFESNNNGWACWWGKGSGGTEAFQGGRTPVVNGVDNALHVNHINNNDDQMRIEIVRILSVAAPGGYKGVPHSIRMCGRARSFRDTIDMGGGEFRWVNSRYSLPWNSAVEPVASI